MRNAFSNCACVLVLATSLLGAESKSQPNIIFVLSDDQAWNGLSTRMHPDLAWSASDFVRTPNIARLAKQGMRFSAAYAPASVCSPTRISLQTGKSPAQLQWTKAAPTMTAANGYKLIPPTIHKHIARDEITIAEMLGIAGYATAHYGKWHIGGGGPGQHGYDAHDGDTGNKAAAPHKDPNPVDIFGMSQRAIAFMKKNHAAKKPFFIQLSYHALHYPENALESTKKEYQARGGRRNEKEITRGALAENLDTGVGMLMKALDELKVADNTYFIYMSDNGSGGGKGNGSLRGGKGGVWEGGIRVPLIIRGPNIQPNTFCHSRVVGYDLYPTFCQWAGVEAPLPKGVEGGSIIPLLAKGKGVVKRPRKELVFHFPHYQSSDGPHTAILSGDLKLIRFYETGKISLFNLGGDISESNDLASKMPDLTKQLTAKLNVYLKQVSARLPVANPQYDPNKPPASTRKGGKGGKGDKSTKKLKPNQSQPKSNPVQPNNPRGARMPTPLFRTEVPAHLYNIILGRPIDSAITLSVLAHQAMNGFVTYGVKPDALTNKTPVLQWKAGEAIELDMKNLKPNTRYYYKFNYQLAGANPTPSILAAFHTLRATGSPFVFTVQADSHLDFGTNPAVYERTLKNALADRTDFHIALGDTFMTGKYVDHRKAYPHYLAQRYYFGRLCHSASLFFVLGNHDGESLRYWDGTANNPAAWSANLRKELLPNPSPNVFYTGNSQPQQHIGLLEDYYAWEWGDGLFVTLDPFLFTQRTRGKGDNWNWTLGKTQYDWLARTLANSKRKYKFIFLHHLVGGFDRSQRGGKGAATYFEWGGRNWDGENEFAVKRPGWAKPIHELLVQHGVSIVFHGHDHLFAKEELDGIIYQCVPQPSHSRGATRSATEYGYKEGVILGSSGHIRVTVSANDTKVDYVKSILPDAESNRFKNGMIAHSYQLGKRIANAATPPPVVNQQPQAASFNVYAPKVRTRWDKQYLYVESNGIPGHQMMVGITAWQQQVPIPQPYTGNNAWRIPLQPVQARTPISAKNNFFRGAIALAANGVPIFNPIKNDGRTDTFLAGELDRFGGHCGRGDDYHYHIAPLHLQNAVGQGKPIAYALDGYPLLGLTEVDGTAPKNLDALKGHSHGTLGYHYHATKTYPYINGGFRGQVTQRDGQVDPQPRAQPVRPALPPLRGAKITGFKEDEKEWKHLTYEINQRLGSVKYIEVQKGSYLFEYDYPNGNTTTEIHQRRQPRGGRLQNRPPR